MNGPRRHPILLACLGLIGLMFLFSLGIRAPTTSVRVPGVAEPGPRRADVDRSPASGVFALDSASSRPPARAVDYRRPQAPRLPFAFLGKLQEGGRTAIVLYRGGVTLMVRGTGKLDEDYDVEAIEESFLVLRYVPLGERQVLELKAPAQAIAPHGAAEETPQD